MTDDFKERLRNPDHNWHEAACAEAEHRIEAQAAEIEFHKERADALALQADEWEGKYLIGIAEIERLRSVIDATALHWLALQDKHPIQWEGAIDGAMAAACAEIERLREALGELSGNTGKLPIRENENG